MKNWRSLDQYLTLSRNNTVGDLINRSDLVLRPK